MTTPPPKRGETQITGAARAAALEAARQWRIETRAFFDALDAEGAFRDSPRRYLRNASIPDQSDGKR